MKTNKIKRYALPRLNYEELALLVKVVHTIEIHIEERYGDSHPYADCCIVFTDTAQSEFFKTISRRLRYVAEQELYKKERKGGRDEQ